MKQNTGTILKLLVGLVAGYILSHHLSHPNGRARKHVPIVRLTRIQVLPNLLIATKNKTWHIHHWAYIPAFYLPLIAIVRSLANSHWLNGFVLGSIIHGLTFSDRFKFKLAS